MLHMLSALKHEARPIIEHYRLEHDGGARPFTSYRNNEISLTITGVGKQAAMEGTRFAAEYYHAGDRDAWLNIGIAGHRSLPIGTLVLANKITDSESQQVWYPRLPFPTSLDTLPLTTVNAPEVDYKDNDMIDMEAAGFYRSACRIGSLDLIHALKIISDNEAHPSARISKQSVLDFFDANLMEIDKLVTQLQLHSEA